LDVGAGTQDILLFQEDVPLEGSTKMVLPSRTVLVAKRIKEAGEVGSWTYFCAARPWEAGPAPEL